jgi:hypothetical protein
MQSH